MKRTFAQLFNFLMACTILVSSTGFGMVERSCHMRGKTVYLNLKEAEAKRCVSDQKAPATGANRTAVDKTPCCKDETTYENVDVTSSLAQLVAKFLKTITHAIEAGAALVLTWLINVISSSASPATITASPPPLPAGRSLLVLIQSFLI